MNKVIYLSILALIAEMKKRQMNLQHRRANLLAPSVALEAVF